MTTLIVPAENVRDSGEAPEWLPALSSGPDALAEPDDYGAYVLWPEGEWRRDILADFAVPALPADATITSGTVRVRGFAKGYDDPPTPSSCRITVRDVTHVATLALADPLLLDYGVYGDDAFGTVDYTDLGRQANWAVPGALADVQLRIGQSDPGFGRPGVPLVVTYAALVITYTRPAVPALRQRQRAAASLRRRQRGTGTRARQTSR